MKKIVVFLTLVFLFAIAFQVTGADNSTEQHGKTNVQGLSGKDVEQIKDAVSGLRQVFGVEEPQQQAKDKKTSEQSSESPEKTQPQQKNMADVADKAVDMASKMVAQTAEQLQKVAPDVWRIMIKQQYAKAISDVIVPVFLFLLTICYFKIAKKYWKLEEASKVAGDSEFSEKDMCFVLVHFLPFIAGFVTAGWMAVRISYSVLYLINPEYYAIRDMLMMILNKGTIN